MGKRGAGPANDHEHNDKPPLWVRLVLIISDFIVRRCSPCSVTGRQHYTAAPATIVVSNHRRDADGPLLGSVLLRRQRGRLVEPLPRFVARDDLFEKGFLADYLHHWPTALRAGLALINLRPFLIRCGTYPLKRIPDQSVAEVLRDLLDTVGNIPVAQALRASRLQALADAAAFDADTAHIADLVDGHSNLLRRTRYGYRHLRPAMFRRLKPQLRKTIERQLEGFADLLERGHMLILEPEGRLSRDGRLCRPRAALHELINRPSRPVRVLPVAITYDALTTGRPRIFVDIQPELTGLRGLDRCNTDRRVTNAIRAGCRVTASQLTAGFLLCRIETNDGWSAEPLARAIFDAAQKCHAAAIPLDPSLLDRPSCDDRVRDLLDWGVAAGLLARTGDMFRVSNPDLSPPWLPDGPTPLLEYLCAELQATVGPDRARELGLLP